MSEKPISFLATAKRLFEPAFFLRKQFFLGFLQVAFRPIYGIVTTLVLAKAVSYIELADKDSFFITLVGFVVFVIVYQLLNGALKHGGQQYSWNAYSYLFRHYFARYIKLDNNKTEIIGTGKMLSIMDKGIDQIVQLNMYTVWLGSAAIMQILFVTYLLTKVTRFAPLMLYVFLVLTLVMSYHLTTRGNSRREKRNDAVDDATRQIVKVLMSKFEILLNNKIEDENKRFAVVAKEILYNDSKKQFYEHWGFNVPTIMLSVITISLFVFLGYKFFYQNDITYAEIVLYLGLVNSLETGTRSAIDLYKAYAKNFQRITKLWKTFDEIPEMHGYDKGKMFVFAKGDILFDKVSFKYGDSEVLHDISFALKGGKKTALVGVSGGGKSTIIKLIAGYLNVSSGVIHVDGQELPTTHNSKKSISLQSYYKHIGYLTQDPSVFDGTIYDNLTYALDHKPTSQEMTDAIEKAQCHFIYDFKDGLLTEIGERGVRLSGGQRQRLAIAKIFLKNPQIVLLDEPTSALDSLSEEAITKAMHNLFQGRTVVIIAHRLQTVKQADDIVVIEEGKILERGTHDQLVAQGGHYAKMLELQSGF